MSGSESDSDGGADGDPSAGVGFNVGDHVRIEANSDKAHRLQKGFGGWNRKMNQSCGVKGFVYTITDHDPPRVKVAHPKGYRFSWNPANLVRIGGSSSWDSGAVEEGARVRLRPEVGEPSFGWGGVEPEEVGEVLSVDGDKVRVDFPSRDGKSWTGFRVEFEAEGASEDRGIDDISKFNIGDQVTWCKHDEDIDEGDVGDVVGYTDDGNRVRVQFEKGRWFFRPHTLTVVSSAMLREGDRVTWTSKDEDVPRGSVGTFVEYVQDRIRVEFPKGTWTFKKASIRLHGRFGFNVGDPVNHRSAEGEVGVVVGFGGEEVSVQVGKRTFRADPGELERPDHFSFEKGDAVVLAEGAEADGAGEGEIGVCLEYDNGSWTVHLGKRRELRIAPGDLSLVGRGFDGARGKCGALVGDWVQWRKGNGSVPAGVYGEVKSFKGRLACCEFDEDDYCIDPSSLSIVARRYVARGGDESWFAVRDKVRWSSSDADIPEGDVGTVRELRLHSVKAQWESSGKLWTIGALQHTLHSRFGYSVGDRVAWSKSDEDVPPGTAGTVVALRDPKFKGSDEGHVIKVKFPKGAWSFRPASLLMASEDEVPAEEDDLSGGFTEKHALIIACSYVGLKAQLKGVARDAYRTHEWLQSPPLCVPADNIVTLSDDPACAKATGARGKPTQANMKKCMRELMRKSGPGTLQFLLYSGHGGNVRGTKQGFETAVCSRTGRKQDQALIPINYKEDGLEDGGYVRDNWILEKFIMPMHEESTTLFVADCCHSGTIADLPYQYNLQPHPHVQRVGPLIPKSDVFVFAGCRDEQTSKDLGSRVGGALTSTILPLLSGWRQMGGAGNPPVEAFLDRLRKKVSDKLREKTQTPVLSSSIELTSSLPLPLDRPRQRYGGATRDFDDDFEDSEDEAEPLVSFDDEDADAVDVEPWDLDHLEEIDVSAVVGGGGSWEADGDIWADYEPPASKGSVVGLVGEEEVSRKLTEAPQKAKDRARPAENALCTNHGLECFRRAFFCFG